MCAHAKKAHIFYGLHSASLIYLVKLWDDDCVTILDKNEINILKGKTLILNVHRNKTYGLWYIPISRPERHDALVIITIDNTRTELIQYLHWCCFGPNPSTLLKAIQNENCLTWPGLKNQQLLNHLPPNIVTALLHMDQERKILQTKKRVRTAFWS